MRIIFLLFVAVALFSMNLHAQISKGGQPASFKFEYEKSLSVNVPVKSMPLVDVETLKAEDIINDTQKDRPWRFGYNIPVNIDVKSYGVQDVVKGGKIWRLSVYSEGALSMNFRFSNFKLPAGASLFIYNKEKDEILGAFTDFNNRDDGVFATTLIKGENIIFEYFEPEGAAFEGQLVLDRVTHGYRSGFHYAKAFGESESCQNNVACSVSAGWEDQINAVVMLVVSGSGFCTGSVINNTSNDGTPYVLTANHCSESNDFASWVFWFNWQSATCANPSSSPAHQSISGCTLKSRSTVSDFCLVLMSSAPPQSYNAFYAGWEAGSTAPTNTVGIHHPSGDIKKISFDNNAATNTSWGGASCWRIISWDDGVTEPGSSGSPLFNQNHKIIGQLFGGGSTCTNMAASDYYGRFGVSWNGANTSATRLKDWLDPTTTGLTTLSGINPFQVANDAGLYNIQTPVSFYCSEQNVTPTVSIINKGSSALSSVQVAYNIDGANQQIYTWTGNLNYNETAVINFPQAQLNAGVHTFNAYTILPNGQVDLNTANDTVSLAFIVKGYSTPFSQNFESTKFPPTDWTINNPDASTTWARKTAFGNGGGSYGASVNCFAYTTTSQTDDLISPPVDLSGLTSAELSFYVAYRQKDANSTDGLKVFISTDCGATWQATPIYDKSGSTLATSTILATSFTPTTAAVWRKETVSLNSFVGNGVMLKFQSINMNGNNIFIDNILIDWPTNVTNIDGAKSFSIYPNPTQNRICIDNPAGTLQMVEVYNQLGQKIVSSNVSGGKNFVDLSNAGIYYFKLFDGLNYYTEKVIVLK